MKLNKIIEVTAFAVGGVSLFLVSFLVFALAAGVSAHEVALLGGMFPEPEPTPEVAEAGEDETEEGRTVLQPKTPDELVQSILGNLPTLTAATPYQGGEVERIVNELKAQKLKYQELIGRVEAREEALDAREATLDEQAALINELKDGLDTQQADIELARAELERDVEIEDERQVAVAKKKSVLFIDKKADVPSLARKLEEMDVAEAALILDAMGDENEKRRNELLLAMEPTASAELLDAWAALGN